MKPTSLAGDRRTVRSPPSGAYAQGLIAAVALGSLASSGGGTATGVVPVAIGMGIAAAVFAVAGWLSAVSEVFYSLTGTCCFRARRGPIRSVQRLPTRASAGIALRRVALLVVVALVMLAARVMTLRRIPALSAGLALYAALQVLIPLSTFIAGEASASMRCGLQR